MKAGEQESELCICVTRGAAPGSAFGKRLSSFHARLLPLPVVVRTSAAISDRKEKLSPGWRP